MDRNVGWLELFLYYQDVALRKESVDRNNPLETFIILSKQVALRKESVDRNRGRIRQRNKLQESLSARRAWIEMSISVCWMALNRLSLSARRAWIEIFTRKTFAYVSYVALRKESVDRNC